MFGLALFISFAFEKFFHIIKQNFNGKKKFILVCLFLVYQRGALIQGRWYVLILSLLTRTCSLTGM